MRRYVEVTATVIAGLGFGIAYVQADTRNVVQSASVIVEVAPLTNGQEASMNAVQRAEDWQDCALHSAMHRPCNWKSL